MTSYILCILHFARSMNFLFFGCTIFRGNQVIKNISRRSTKRWKRTEPLARGFHFRKTFTFTKLSLSQICHIHKVKEAVFNIFNILQLSIIKGIEKMICKQILFLFSRVKILRKKICFSFWFFPQFLFQFWWEIIFCYLVGFWPAVFCRKGKYFKKTVLCCWAIF